MGWPGGATDRDVQRFLNHVIITPGGCWEWTAFLTKKGYGTFHSGLKCGEYAHRFSKMLFHGEFDYKLLVCHKCDNPKCVNPEHLFSGTCLDNIRDMFSKGRQPDHSGEKNWAAKLTAIQVLAARNEYAAGGISKYRLAKNYGVTKATMLELLSGKTWKNVGGLR
jgi:hypothetical protein